MKAQELTTREKVAAMGVSKDMLIKNLDHHGKGLDRQHAVGLADINHKRTLGLAQLKSSFDGMQQDRDRHNALQSKGLELAAQAQESQAQRSHGGVVRATELLHEATQKHADRQHSMLTRGVELAHEHIQNTLANRATEAQGVAEREHTTTEAEKDRAHQKAMKPAEKPKKD